MTINVPSQSAAGMRHDDVWVGRLHRVEQGRVEHAVAAPVEGGLARRLQAEAHHRPHRLDDRAGAVLGGMRFEDDRAEPEIAVQRRDRAEAGLGDGLLVAGAADQRQVLGQALLGDLVEMVGMQMRDDDEVDPGQDVLDRQRQIDHGICRAAGDGAPAVARPEIGIDEDRLAGIAELERGVAEKL
jgi:hypothetical protein